MKNVIIMVRRMDYGRQEFFTLQDCVASAEAEHDDFTAGEILEIAFQEFLHLVIGEIRNQAEHHEQDSFWDCGKGFTLEKGDIAGGIPASISNTNGNEAGNGRKANVTKQRNEI